MKIKLFQSFAGLLFFGLITTSCNPASNQNSNIVLKDFGPQPTVLDIEAHTLSNNYFRVALWTGEFLQLTVMSIPVGGEIGLEQHPDTDQFLRIESGKAKVMMGDTEHSLTFVKEIGEDFAIFVPAGKWHNLINIGNKPLKIYSIYAPVEHPHGTIHRTPEDDDHHH